MKFRTRVAFVVITLLMGLAFASPFRRSTVTPDPTPSEPRLAPPLLRIQPATAANTPPQWHEEVADQTGTTRFQAAFPPLPDRDADAPMLAGSANELRPVRFQDDPANIPRPLKPVKLMGIDTTPASGAGLRHAPAAPETNSADPGTTVERFPTAPHIPNIPKVTPEPGRDIRAPRTWHRIVNGDSLSSLARTYLGDERLGLLIYERNRDALASPDILPIGVELRIPSRAEAEPSPDWERAEPKDARGRESAARNSRWKPPPIGDVRNGSFRGRSSRSPG